MRVGKKLKNWKEENEAVEPVADRVNSVIGDKEVVDAVKEKEIVNASLDLFGGTIVDIHG